MTDFFAELMLYMVAREKVCNRMCSYSQLKRFSAVAVLFLFWLCCLLWCNGDRRCVNVL